MDEFKKALKSIENPICFLSKNSFKNLSLIRDFENTMSSIIDTLKVNSRKLKLDPLKWEQCETSLGKLENTFCGFDSVSFEIKKKSIADASRFIEELKVLCHDMSRVPSTQKNLSAKVVTMEEVGNSCQNLSLPVQSIKGVGPRISQLLSKKGLKTVEDLLYFLPKTYEDRRFFSSISSARIGKRETIVATVVDARNQTYKRRKLFEVTLEDGSGRLTAKWFHGGSQYLKNIFKKGNRVILTGEVKQYLSCKNMLHPDFEVFETEEDESIHFQRIVPVYSETEGLHQKNIRRIMMQLIQDYSRFVVSPIPYDICRRNRLVDMDYTLRNIHFPDSDQDVELLNSLRSDVHRRLIFDEFFFFALEMALKRREYRIEEGISFAANGPLLNKFYTILPYTLTDAQKRVIAEIQADMTRNNPMNRLLHGDVGSGKTVVSMAAMVTSCENGFQAAIMTPTEILAEQHYSNMKKWAEELGISVTLLTGNTKTRERKKITRDIETGDIKIIIGTHALIQESVVFKNLGLIIIDEQHRFGVAQRATLRKKGVNPDVLVMTATPIPRTLAMTAYGDLDISVIDETPPGRKTVKTKIFNEKDRYKVYEIILKEVEKGNQVFIVYPLVEESETLDMKDATSMAQHLQKNIFPQFRTGLIHGRMKASEKENVMEDFLKTKIDILVSTTVIEVGIDVPNASLMVIEHAERFGLSQLHQLRGRVGRRDLSSYCILLAGDNGSEDARKRLHIMEQTSDGFEIAEEDLSIRGPGEFLGTRQSGVPDFRIAHILRDARILNEAREEAFMLVKKDPCLQKPENRILIEELRRRWKGRFEFAKTG